MNPEIEAFLSQYQVPTTKQAYKYALLRFTEWWLSVGKKENWVKDYIDHLLKQGVSNKTVNNQVIIVQQFYKYLDLPTYRFKRLKENTSPIEVLNQGDIEKLLAAAGEEFGAILRFMLDTGVRGGEMARIATTRVTEIPKEWVIVGKGSKQRILVVSDATMERLRKTMKDGFLFGSSWPYRRIERYLKRTAIRAGLRKRVHSHLMRHTFATQMLEKGVGVDRLQKMLGHSNIMTTQIYTHVSDTQLQQEWKAALAK